MTSRSRPLLAWLLLLVLIATGCTTLPETGPVRTRPDSRSDTAAEAPYFQPPGPEPGDTPEEVVRGFLLAMQANPPSTAIARAFLTSAAGGSWNPSLGTLIYDAPTVAVSSDEVRVRLAGTHELDARGGWSGPSADVAGGTQDFRFRVVEEAGQWRIANPPDKLVVPASYFASLFLPFDLYFFDQTRRVLVPDRVYLPPGEQTATTLARGLLQGPGPDLSDVVRSAFPDRTTLDLGVVVTGNGTAQIPLGPGILKLSPADLTEAVAQMARTLAQVPGIARLRLTVDGAPVPLPGGSTDVAINSADDLRPGAGVREHRPMVVTDDGRVSLVSARGSTPVGGPLGRDGFALRSLAAFDAKGTLAAVSATGRRVFLAPASGSTNPARVRAVVNDGTNLLRPAFDMFGDLWLVDRTPRGARVRVLARGTLRDVTVPGVTGQRISAFTITPDGTRLVATRSAGQAPAFLVSEISRDGEGTVRLAGPARLVVLDSADLGPASDVGLVGPTTLALLTHPHGTAARVLFAELDGSPGGPTASPPDVVPDTTVALVASPYAGSSLRLVTSTGQLLHIDSTGGWVRAKVGSVSAATLPR